MGDVVVIKFGGGLITDKSQMCTPELTIIDDLVGVVRQCVDIGLGNRSPWSGFIWPLRAKYWR